LKISPLKVIHTLPSAFDIGWWPPETSMMLKRACPIPIRPLQ